MLPNDWSHWTRRIRYDWWTDAIAASYGHYYYYKYVKLGKTKDEIASIAHDVIGCYCMGGEL